jgi:hypothetical protein
MAGGDSTGWSLYATTLLREEIVVLVFLRFIGESSHIFIFYFFFIMWWLS